MRAAEDEVLDAVAQQVRARRFDEMQERQLVLERKLLCALKLLEPHRLQRAGFDARVVDDDHAMRAAHDADAGEQAAAGDRLLGVGHVEQVTRAGGQFEPRRARVEQQREPLARQQLAATREAWPGAVRGGGRAGAQLVVPRDQPEHVRAVLGECGAGGVQRRLETGMASPGGKVSMVEQALA